MRGAVLVENFKPCSSLSILPETIFVAFSKIFEVFSTFRPLTKVSRPLPDSQNCENLEETRKASPFRCKKVIPVDIR